MKNESINKVEVLSSGELALILESGGISDYQYVYREGAGVYWDEELRGFKSTIPKNMSYAQWFAHLVGVVRTALGVNLLFSDNVSWLNISEEVKAEITDGNAV